MDGYVNIVHARHVAWRTYGLETIVLDLMQKQMFGFNHSAAAIWEFLAEPRQMKSIIGRSPVNGTAAFLQQLVDLGLLMESHDVVDGRLKDIDTKPELLWQEPMLAVAATCAFLPAQSALCNQNPFS